MSAFPTNFEHGALALIWQASLALAGVSFVLAVTLIARHALNERMLSRHAARKGAMVATLQAALVSLKESGAVPPMTLDMPVAIEIALDWLRNLSGQQAENITHMLRLLGSETYLDHALAHGNKAAKIQALIYCSFESSPASLRHLVNHCAETDKDIQVICLRGLAKRGAHDALADTLNRPALLALKSTLVLADIFMKLGEDGLPFLIGLMGNGRASTEIRMAAVMALGHTRSLDAVAPLMALCRLQDVPDDVRAQALNALGRIGDQRAEVAVLAGLDTPHVMVRVNAISAALRLRCHSFVPKLSALLDDPSWWVRFRAAQALSKIGGAGDAVLLEAGRGQGRGAEIAQEVMDENGMRAT